MSKIIRKRVSALLVSALMVASSVTVTSGSFFVEAAGSTVTDRKDTGNLRSESGGQGQSAERRQVHIYVQGCN